MRVITPIKHPDGTFVLINQHGDKYNLTPGERMHVWATVKMDGREYYVTLPVTLAQLETAPDVVEQRLVQFASEFT